MSDTSQGPGWWQASDGKWYPPQDDAAPTSTGTKRRGKFVLPLIGCGALLVVAMVIGAAAGAPKKKPAADPPATTQATVVTTVPASTSPTTDPPASSTTSVPSTTLPAEENTVGGIGSTVAVMRKVHGADRGPGQFCTVADVCFGGAIRNAEDGSTYQFSAVDVTGGVVDGYTQAFTTGSDLSIAQEEILRWLPSDARAGPVAVQHSATGSCAIYDIFSPTLAKVLGTPKIGDSAGVLGVVLTSPSADLTVSKYDPSDVESAGIGVGPEDPTTGC